MSQEPYQLSAKLKKSIREWTVKFPRNKRSSAVIMALRLVQNEHGHIEDAHVAAVANFLNMPLIQAQEVSRFYSMYRHTPSGQFKLKVCNSVSCYLRGSEQLLNYLADKLDVQVNATTEDGVFSLEETECLGACCSAPCMLVGDDDYQMNMDLEKADQLIDCLKEGAES